MSMLSSLTGGGGISGGDNGAKGGSSGVTSGTGAKNINIGGNPNVTSGGLNVAFIVAGVALVAFLYFRKK